MSEKLADFYRDDTKRWRVVWPTNITGAQLHFMMRKDTAQTEPDLQI